MDNRMGKRGAGMVRSLQRPLSRMQGQSMVEYFIVTSLAVLVLIEGGQSSPVQSVIDAMKQAYAGFTYALGYATTLTGF